MVEVFKTNITDGDHANMLISRIQTTFFDFKANFDLDDCDKILRVTCETGAIHAVLVIEFLKSFNCFAEVLPDEIPKAADAPSFLGLITH
jgi:hypothetical protein